MSSTDAPAYTYEGNELDLFAGATVWKSYVRRRMDPYIGRDVLEVGAGLGGMTRVLDASRADRWVCLEPDPALADRLTRSIAEGALPDSCQVVVGTLDQAQSLPPFDTLLYMDVLEHIEDDRAEVSRAAERLKPGGHLIVLSPAHPFLYTPFDAAIGHHRRYTKQSLRAAAPPEAALDLVRLSYLDTVGLLASLGNRLVLNSAMPNPRQIALWDRVMVRMSRLVDPALNYTVGKSVLGVWRKRG